MAGGNGPIASQNINDFQDYYIKDCFMNLVV